MRTLNSSLMRPIEAALPALKNALMLGLIVFIPLAGMLAEDADEAIAADYSAHSSQITPIIRQIPSQLPKAPEKEVATGAVILALQAERSITLRAGCPLTSLAYVLESGPQGHRFRLVCRTHRTT